ncbi:MAG: hypothetical protein ORN23_07760 [Chthoniobacterales bacterium]|nr:hypothetical protein [Chthoniobacterales bacterium]
MGASHQLHGSDKKETPALLLGGYFERPPIHCFLPRSKKTLLFPAHVSRHSEVTPLGSDAGMSPEAWDRFLKESREDTSLLMATLNPLMVRDAHEVIQAAVMSSDDPRLASCILNPGFLRRFSAIFGPELIVAIPSRTKIYVFPKLANRLPEMSQVIRDDYLISPQPVSKELFEVSKKGMRAIGTVDPDDE